MEHFQRTVDTYDQNSITVPNNFDWILPATRTLIEIFAVEKTRSRCEVVGCIVEYYIKVQGETVQLANFLREPAILQDSIIENETFSS